MEKSEQQYREHIKRRLGDLQALFAQAAVGDFSTSIEIPENEDEDIVELYTGVNIMLDVIKRQLSKEEQINKAKSEFVALVSHQLRTPLSVIKWSIEDLRLSDISSLGSEEKKDLDTIYRETQRMVALINTILDVSRIELGTLSVSLKEIDFVATGHAALMQVTPQALEKEIALSEKYEPENITATADASLLHAIFQNLLSNAVKYTLRGGKVELSVTQDHKRILITVGDTGYGIAEADKDRVFEKLYRTANARKADPEGTGLGLYIVKSIVTEAGGDIWFESQVGKGTTFFVEFPRDGMHAQGSVPALKQ
jgi:signal transduction histidine kinase